MAKNVATKQEIVATERFNLISTFIDENLTKKERLSLIKEKSLNGGPSVRTLKRYLESYQEGGFTALMPKNKVKSIAKAVEQEILDLAITARRENPQRSIKDIIYILEVRGDVEKGSLKRSTLQRYFQKAGFSKKQMNNYVKSRGVATRRYRKSHRMEQLQSDFKYGPYLPIGKNNKMIQTYFIGWIDNSSRMMLDGKFYSRQTFYEVEDSLRRVIMKYGTPSTILLDNGKPYISKNLETVCAKCSIQKIHAKPFSPQTKGLIEVFNAFLNKFISEAALEKYNTLEEMNSNYDAWVEQYYNKTLHSGLKEGTPRSAFAKDSKPLRFISDELLVNAFSTRVTRKVNNDCTISIDGTNYDIQNPNLIGFEVEVIYDPQDKEKVVVRKIGFEDIIANPLVISSFVKKEAKREATGKSVLPAFKSDLLEGVRRAQAKDDFNFDLDLASKAVKRNEEEQLKLSSTEYAYKLSTIKEDENYDRY